MERRDRSCDARPSPSPSSASWLILTVLAAAPATSGSPAQNSDLAKSPGASFPAPMEIPNTATYIVKDHPAQACHSLGDHEFGSTCLDPVGSTGHAVHTVCSGPGGSRATASNSASAADIEGTARELILRRAVPEDTLYTANSTVYSAIFLAVMKNKHSAMASAAAGLVAGLVLQPLAKKCAGSCCQLKADRKLS